MTLEIVPITRDEARAFVHAHHRHNPIAPPSWKWGAALEDDGTLVGVIMAGRPAARHLDDGRTIEITRVATDGTRNANSKLYAAALRAARALGYRRAVTYTHPDESGASLRAVGFREDGTTQPRTTDGWALTRPKQLDLLGTPHRPIGPKTRWISDIA